MAKTYTVVSPLVVLRNPEQGGRQEYVYQGSVLPSFTSDADRQRLLDEGHIALVGDTTVTPITTPDQVDPLTGNATPVGAAGTGVTTSTAPTLTVKTMAAGDDPSGFTVDQVQAYLTTADDAERQRVLDAEAAGKNRAGITGQ